MVTALCGEQFLSWCRAGVGWGVLKCETVLGTLDATPMIRSNVLKSLSDGPQEGINTEPIVGIRLLFPQQIVKKHTGS